MRKLLCPPRSLYRATVPYMHITPVWKPGQQSGTIAVGLEQGLSNEVRIKCMRLSCAYLREFGSTKGGCAPCVRRLHIHATKLSAEPSSCCHGSCLFAHRSMQQADEAYRCTPKKSDSRCRSFSRTAKEDAHPGNEAGRCPTRTQHQGRPIAHNSPRVRPPADCRASVWPV